MANEQEQILEVSPEMAQRAYLNILEDMQEDKQALEDQRVAIFNILDDANEGQAELKRKYFELDALKKVAEEVGYTLDLKRVLEILSNSIEKLLDYTSVSYMLFGGGEGKAELNIYLRESVGSLFLKSVKKSIEEALQTLASGTPADAALEVQYFGKQVDEKSTAEPQSLFNVPMIIQDKVLGMLNIASTKPNLYEAKEMEPVYTMAAQASLAIVRLRELVASEHSRLGDLVESLSNGVIMFDLDKRITVANPAVQKMTGLPAEGFYMPEFLKLFGTAVVPEPEQGTIQGKAAGGIGLEEKIKQALQAGKTTHIEEVNLLDFTYELFVAPVRDYQKNISGGTIILHDITHYKEIDRMKTEFVSVASHQLRTPLTAIKLFMEMLINEEVGKLNAEQKEYMDNVYQSTERMVKLVNDLLNVSRLETGRLKIEPEPTQIEDFIQSIIDEADPMAKGKKCRLVFERPKEKLPMVQIDPSLMRQVIHNLIMNAIRYSPVKQCDILVKLEKKGHDYLISARDKGIGIPKKDQSRIFDKFFRSDNARKIEAEGSGLGMYVSKMIIEASGGKIWFESEGKDKGTTFYVTIPMGGIKKKKGEKGLA